MTFASPSASAPAKKKAKSTPDKEIVVKVNTSKGFVTLGRIGLYNESSLHTAVTKLGPEQLQQLLAKAQIEIVNYTRNDEDNIQLVL